MTGGDDLDDAALLARVAAVALAPADFRHVEHVRLAFAVLVREPDLAAAAATFRTLLRRLADAFGAAAKYHETLTWAYLALIAERMHGRGYASSRELLADHPDLLDHRGGALAQVYDVEAITRSPLAREVFVLPRRA